MTRKPLSFVSNHRVLVLLLGGLTAFGPLSIDMYLPAFPQIAKGLGAQVSQIQATLAAFTIGMAIGQLFYGPLTDKFGRKKSLLVGLALYVLASLLCSQAASATALIAFRGLQALGACSGVVIARAIVRDRYSGAEAVKVFSGMILVMGAAPILAPSVGGVLLHYFSWRMIFMTLAGIGVVGWLLTFRFLPETHPPQLRNPLALKDAFSIYSGLFKDKTFLGYALTAGFIQAGLFGYIATGSFVFIEHFGLTPQRFALLFGFNAVGLILASQLNSRLLKRYSSHQLLGRVVLVNVLLAGLMVLFARLNWFGIWGIAGPLFFMITCLGLSSPNAMAGALTNHAARAGAASALMGALMFSCGTTGALLQSLLNSHHPLAMAIPFLVDALLALSFFGLLVPRPSSQEDH